MRARRHNVDIPSGINRGGGDQGPAPSAPFACSTPFIRAAARAERRADDANFPALVARLGGRQSAGGKDLFHGEDPSDPQRHGSHCALPTLRRTPTSLTSTSSRTNSATTSSDNFSRADNIGGAHGVGDKLDVRVAFGEGFGYAFSAIVLNDPVARRYFREQRRPGDKARALSTWKTNPPTVHRASMRLRLLVQRVVGLVDSLGPVRQQCRCQRRRGAGLSPDVERADQSQRTTPAFTSIFSFITALKAARPSQMPPRSMRWSPRRTPHDHRYLGHG